MDGHAREMRQGFLEGLPLCVGVAAYGLAFGFLAAEAHMDGLTTGFMGVVMFGSSQIVSVERLISGSGAVAALYHRIESGIRPPAPRQRTPSRAGSASARLAPSGAGQAALAVVSARFPFLRPTR